jgi:hypothetical protein
VRGRDDGGSRRSTGHGPRDHAFSRVDARQLIPHGEPTNRSPAEGGCETGRKAGFSVLATPCRSERVNGLLHPEMARIYRAKVTDTEALRGLVDAIVLTRPGRRDASD